MVCEKIFIRKKKYYQEKIDRGDDFVCDSNCHRKHSNKSYVKKGKAKKINIIFYTCLQCGKIFEYKKEGVFKTRKFCSRACSEQGKAKSRAKEFDASRIKFEASIDMMKKLKKIKKETI